MKTILILFSIGLTMVGSSAAQETTNGSTLLEECRSVNNPDEGVRSEEQEAALVHCLGYIRGVLDTVTVWKKFDGKNTDATVRSTCVPDTVSAGQAAKLVLRYLNTHPENLHWSGPAVILVAMGGTFPCK
jgi:hypothetical protein